jgi:hypothetical protein
MRLRILFCATFVCSLAFAASQGESSPVSATSASDIPHLRKQGTATQLIVDGKPFLVLGSQLSVNSATNLEYWKKVVWPRIVAQAKLNTVVAAVSWAKIEPEEGKFDFSVLDGVIRDVRTHNLRLVLLWFGSWKNGLSSFAPDWVKRDFERFPRAQMVGGTLPLISAGPGRPRNQIAGSRSIELLSPLSDANRDADARAFAALMRHIKAVDGQQHTVIMIQLENEVGMQGDTRDRSPMANKAFEGAVPKELLDYLQKHKDTLSPELRQVWEAAGLKTSGTWEEVFGKSRPTDEIFMAWNFARYIGRVAEAGKAEYPIPMYVNCPQFGFGKEPAPVGSGQSGGPMPDAMDVWRAGAPRIDLFAPDIYSPDFEAWCAKYTRSGNPLFIPETNGGRGSAVKALYAFGRYDAIGYSPMGFDRSLTPDNDQIAGYDLIAQLAPLIAEHQGKGTMSAVLLGPNDPPQKIQVGNYTLEVAFLAPRVEPPPQGTPLLSAAIFIATGPDEYYAAGNDVSVTFSPNTPGPPLAGLATVEEGTFVNGRWVAGRRLAGDDAGQGDYLDLRKRLAGDPDRGIQRVTLYRYR